MAKKRIKIRRRLKRKKRGRPVGLNWFGQEAEDSKQPLRTYKTWWTNFCTATDQVGLTPGKATDADKAAWAAWMKAAKDERATEAKKASEAKKAEALEAAKRKRHDTAVLALRAVFEVDGREAAEAVAQHVLGQ